MKVSNNEIIEFNYLDPLSVYNYLQDNGWKEEDKLGTKASILAISKNQKQYSVLLPLEKELADFASRMYDVFRVLEVVEERPKSEIIAGLKNPQQVAIQKKCEILSLRFKFIFEEYKRELSAKQMGNILISLQDFFDAVGQYELTKTYTKGKIAKGILDQTELSIFETFQGSFGIKLTMAENGQLNLLERPLPERIAQIFLELLRLSNQLDKGKLKQTLLRIKRRAASKYRYFLFYLAPIESDLNFDWGSLNENAGGHVILAYDDILKTIDFINKMEEEEPEEYEIYGRLSLADKKTKKLTIEELDSNKLYSGTISKESWDNLENQGIELTIDNLYSARFQEVTLVNPATEEEKIERTIIKLTPRVRQESNTS